MKDPPKQKLYIDHKVFDESSFNNDLKKIDSIKIISYSSVEDIFINALLLMLL